MERWFNGEDVEVDVSSPFLKYKISLWIPIVIWWHPIPKNWLNCYTKTKSWLSHIYIIIKVSQWLESCGNDKIALNIDNIVNDLYPNDEQAGMMVCVFAMDSTFPYHDINGEICADKQSVCVSMLNNIEIFDSFEE